MQSTRKIKFILEQGHFYEATQEKGNHNFICLHRRLWIECALTIKFLTFDTWIL